MMPQNHCQGDSGPLRKARPRAAHVLCGGPPPLAHQTKSPRKITSTVAATGTPRLKSKAGHTLAGMRAMTIPVMMARNETGNVAQRLRRFSCAVIVVASFRLARHKINDRARERAWLLAGRTNYVKATHRSGAQFASSPC